MQTSKYITIVDKPEYTLRLEYTSDYIAVHLPTIKKLTKSVYLDLLIALDELNDFAETFGKSQLFAGLDANNSKMERFVKKLGFSYMGSSEGIKTFVFDKGEE